MWQSDIDAAIRVAALRGALIALILVAAGCALAVEVVPPDVRHGESLSDLGCKPR